MKFPARPLFCLFLLAASSLARAQDVPPAGPPWQHGQMPRMQMQQLSPEQRERMRERMREERRLRHESWQQMSPEERHQLRRDIRDAGANLYPRGRQRPPE